MTGTNTSGERRKPSDVPHLRTLLVDHRDRVGEFRGEWCGLWYLRPLTGGQEWSVDPEDVRPLTPEQRMRAETARANARSRGEVL